MSVVDDFLAPFNELDENYPGSRQKRRSKAVAPPPEEEQSWDRAPLIRNVDGKDVEFFLIGALAEAVNKSPITIRKWISAGILPNARFRTTGTTVKGSRRLWTRAQIEGIRRIASEEGILTGSNVGATQFTTRVRELFRALKEAET